MNKNECKKKIKELLLCFWDAPESNIDRLERSLLKLVDSISPEWIPVGVSMPIPFRDVLVFYKCGDEAAQEVYHWGGYTDADWQMSPIAPITHWMPLPPAPPSEKKEGSNVTR